MYAYLRVDTAVCDQVTFPDGHVVLVPAGEGEAHAQSWVSSQEPQAPEVDIQSRAKLQEEHEKWASALDKTLSRGSTIGQVRELRERFLEEYPEPGYDGIPAAPAARATTETVTAWTARLEPGPNETTYLSTLETYPFGAVAEHLTRLESDGWTVIQSGEDREVVHHDDRSEAVTREAWFLLHRPSGAG